MSRITGTDAYGLMEAYNAVYASQELTEEQVWEEVENWVNSLLEEGYDLSDYTWEEMYESYLSEDIKSFADKGGLVGAAGRAFSRAGTEQGKAQNRAAVSKFFGGINQGATKLMQTGGVFGRGGAVDRMSGKPPTTAAKPERQGPIVPDRLKQKPPTETPAATTPTRDPAAPAATTPARTPAATTPARTPAAPKVAPTKPVSAQTGDKAKDMDTWAKANPKLAAAAAERARTRGTSSTTNPLMQDMKSRLPAAAPKVAPTPARSGFGVSSAPIAAKASVANVTAPEVKATNTIAATPKLPSVAPNRATGSKKPGSTFEEYDAYDLVLEYLLSEGHVETVEEAHYVMMEMDAETIGTIVEAAADQSDKQIDKGVKTTYKAGNVIDNQHQGRSRGLDRLPSGERAAKTKRMRGRLKARRDDLFGERNKREDAAREEIRKKYGL